MPIHRSPLTAAIFEYPDGLLLGKLLHYPEASDLSRRPSALRTELRIQAEKLSDRLPLIEYHRRQLADEVRAVTISVTIDPLHADIAWRFPVTLDLQAFVWNTEALAQATLPLLGIHVVADDEPQLLTRARAQATYLLSKPNERKLHRLVMLPQPEAFECHSGEFSLEAKSPRELYQSDDVENVEPVLTTISTDLTIGKSQKAFCRTHVVKRIADALSHSKSIGVLLVGEAGVGKTAIIRELVRSRARYDLPYRAYRQTGGSRIVAGMSGFGMWQERCEQLVREAREKQVLLHFGNLFELMEVGQHESSEQGIGDYLRPAIASGKLSCVAECTPQQLNEIQRRNPRMLDAFEQIDVPAATVEDTREILGSVAAELLPQQDASTYCDAIETIVRLHDRFATYSAPPGRHVTFLTHLVEDSQTAQFDLNSETTTAMFSVQTGLPRKILDDAIPLDLDDSDTWFNARVMGQRPAVSRVIDALANIKTGLTRPGRPIASLLMIGPTGVGKTELAKTLTEFLYQHPDRMTRIDMSEFADPLAAERLAGASWQDEGVLTARVREQPFGVVLLDEFEKAHPDVFDLLLQILGEGRLTDSAGRTADFSNSVVIMTSNLGAETARSTDLGFQAGAETGQRLADHYLREVRRFLRPEIFNRIDHIVPFASLSRETLRKIVVKQLQEVASLVADRADRTSVVFAADLVGFLADQGYEPDLGARPIRRQIDRLILAPIAERLNESQHKKGGTIDVSLVGERIRVKVSGKALDHTQVAADDRQARELAQRAMQARRRARKLLTNYLVEDDRNDRERIDRERMRLEKRRQQLPPAEASRLAELTSRLRTLDDNALSATEIEEKTLLAVYGNRTHIPSGAVSDVETRNAKHLIDLYGRACGGKRLVLVLLGKELKFLDTMTSIYKQLCANQEMSATGFFLFERRPNLETLPTEAFPLASEELRAQWRQTKQLTGIEFFALPESSAHAKAWPDLRCGFAFEIQHILAAAYFAEEAGLHERSQHRSQQRVEIVSLSEPFQNYVPVPSSDLRRNLKTGVPRRIYSTVKNTIRDRVFGIESPCRRESDFEHVILNIIDWRLGQNAERWLQT